MSFITEATLDSWIRFGHARRDGALLIARDGERFFLQEALRVLGRRNRETDPYGLTGLWDTMREFIRKGGRVAGDAMSLGPAIYDIEHGVIALPLTREHVAS